MSFYESEKYKVVDSFVDFIVFLNETTPCKGIINLTGGEPFAYKDLEPLLSYIYRLNLLSHSISYQMER